MLGHALSQATGVSISALVGDDRCLRGFASRARKASPRIPEGTLVRSLLALATPGLADEQGSCASFLREPSPQGKEF